MTTWKQIIEVLKLQKPRSAWAKGVRWYAYYIIKHSDVRLTDTVQPATMKKKLLMGAPSWKDYSKGGFALIYNGDIAKRLCSPSELKRVKSKDGNYYRDPSPREDWLDVQGRALSQAYMMIERAFRAVKN